MSNPAGAALFLVALFSYGRNERPGSRPASSNLSDTRLPCFSMVACPPRASPCRTAPLLQQPQRQLCGGYGAAPRGARGGG